MHRVTARSRGIRATRASSTRGRASTIWSRSFSTPSYSRVGSALTSADSMRTSRSSARGAGPRASCRSRRTRWSATRLTSTRSGASLSSSPRSRSDLGLARLPLVRVQPASAAAASPRRKGSRRRRWDSGSTFEPSEIEPDKSPVRARSRPPSTFQSIRLPLDAQAQHLELLEPSRLARSRPEHRQRHS